jgi:DNA-binding beta-propeller fold protein YncE
VYVASLVDGVMEIQPGANPRVVREFPTGSRVLDVEFDPAANDLLLAMEHKGAKRLSLSSGKLTRITDSTCPVSVAMEHSGSRYYVMYQCSGPQGRNGHDALEVFDSRTDRSLAVIAGPPMVGSRPAISPDDLTVLLDGGDACTSAEYDHEGCRISPGLVTHVLDSRALHVVATLGFPFGMAGPAQVDNRRFLILGESVEVIDAHTHAVLERIPTPGPYRNTTGHAAFSPDGKRLWMNLVALGGRPENENAVAVLNLNGAAATIRRSPRSSSPATVSRPMQPAASNSSRAESPFNPVASARRSTSMAGRLSPPSGRASTRSAVMTTRSPSSSNQTPAARCL